MSEWWKHSFFHSFKTSPELQLFFFVFVFWNFLRWSSLVVPSLPSAAPPQTWTPEDWFSTSESCKPSDWSTQNLSYQNSMASQKSVRLQVAPWGLVDSKEVWVAYMRRRRQFVVINQEGLGFFPLFLGVFVGLVRFFSIRFESKMLMVLSSNQLAKSNLGELQSQHDRTQDSNS